MARGSWLKVCGDKFVNEMQYSAKLFFSIRIDFKTKEEKEAFSAKFSVSGPMVGVNATLDQASQEFSRDSVVTVSGIQMGGNTDKLTDILSGTEKGRAGYVQCTLGDFTSCAGVIQQALTYATDTTKGFPSQLAVGVTPGPTETSCSTAPYESMGIFDENYPGLAEVTKHARFEVAQEFEKQFKYKVTIDRILLSKSIGFERKSKLMIQATKADTNVNKILEISKGG